jgi:hypothetical protein
MIIETLTALEHQTIAEPFEIVVPDSSNETSRRAIAERFPEVELLTFVAPTSIPELRARGMTRARGEIIVMLEDHCIPAPDWLSRIAADHHELAHPAISGCVENGATEATSDWAHYLFEYSDFAPPLQGGETDAIAGNCASYKRAALDAIETKARRWEYFIHRDLLQHGHRFYCDPKLRVVHKLSFNLRELISQRYHYSRSFVAMRCDGSSGLVRIKSLLASPLLPFLLMYRTIRNVLGKRRYGRELVRTFPILCLLAIASGIGEFVGALAGDGGSLAKVR